MIEEKSLEETKQKKSKMLSPKMDVVFQALFGEIGSEKITKGFLESILKEELNDVDLSRNIVLRRKYKDDKLGILDVFARINGIENCNIELQIAEHSDILKRILNYWSRIYSREIMAGEKYGVLHRAICILITDYSLERIKALESETSFIGEEEEFNNLRYHTKWQIVESEGRKIILTNQLEIHIISLEELRKTPEERKKQEKLLDWLEFLENPESERVRRKMEENKELGEARKKLNVMSEDEEMQIIAEMREMARMDAIAEKEAWKILGLQEGREKGIEEGREKGIKEGIKEVAKRMLAKHIQIDTVMEITGLSKEEIENL